MKIQVFGCSHHTAPIHIREQLSLGAAEVDVALLELRRQFAVEAVLLSTCNRVELYSAAPAAKAPTCRQWVDFLARFHCIDVNRIVAQLQRLFCKLPQLNERSRREIQRSFDRLLGKLMHPPLQSLREESRDGVPNDLLEAIDTLFQLEKSA